MSKRNLFNQWDLLPEDKNQKTHKHSGLQITQPLMCTEIKFAGFILCKKHIFIAFFKFSSQSPRNATCGVLNFTERAMTLKQMRI